MTTIQSAPVPVKSGSQRMSLIDNTSTSVKVAVRCRPYSKTEKDRGDRKVISVDSGTTLSLKPKFESGKGDTPFVFNHVYDEDAQQTQVYEDIAKHLLDGAFEGYNGTVFAYGQTGSGKTHTVMGNGNNPGLVPQLYTDLFERIKVAHTASMFEGSKDSAEGDSGARVPREILVTCSFLEIYQEVIYDLLNPDSKSSLNIREKPGQGVIVDGLAEIVVKSYDEIAKLLEDGNKQRTTASTKMNDRSSRSHCILTVNVKQRMAEGKVKGLYSKLNLVDLAGSERVGSAGSTGLLFKEGAAINMSLVTLGIVINALADKKRKDKYIPYRDSKLTRLLQESLGGNMKTCMIATISPAESNHAETLSTLNYASRAMNIQNILRKNAELSPAKLQELQGEIAELRQKLEQAHAGDLRKEELQLLEEREKHIKDLQEQGRQTWEELESLSQKYEEERKQNLARKYAMKMQEVVAKKREGHMKLKETKHKFTRVLLMARIQQMNEAQKELQTDSEKTLAELREALESSQKRIHELESDLVKPNVDEEHLKKKEELENLKEIRNHYSSMSEIVGCDASMKDQLRQAQRKNAALVALLKQHNIEPPDDAAIDLDDVDIEEKSQTVRALEATVAAKEEQIQGLEATVEQLEDELDSLASTNEKIMELFDAGSSIGIGVPRPIGPRLMDAATKANLRAQLAAASSDSEDD